MKKKIWSGISFCITGKTITKRAALKKSIERSGGTYMNTVNSKCMYLVIADPNSTTVKANAARALGVKLISEDQFHGLISGDGDNEVRM